MVGNNLKKCSKCKEIKEVEQFCKNKNSPDGYQSECKKCKKEYNKKVKERRILQQRQYKERNKERIILKNKIYYENNKEIILNKKKKIFREKVKFSSRYKDKLIKYGYEIKSNNGYLEIKCKYCKKWFTPTNLQVKLRIEAIEGTRTIGTENHLYCSVECKKKCPVFNKKRSKIERITQKNKNNNIEWIKYILKNSNYKCEICGSEEDLQAHHIIPVAVNPLLSEDIDNGICLCKNCHYKIVHKLPGCDFSSLKKIKCVR